METESQFFVPSSTLQIFWLVSILAFDSVRKGTIDLGINGTIAVSWNVDRTRYWRAINWWRRHRRRISCRTGHRWRWINRGALRCWRRTAGTTRTPWPTRAAWYRVEFEMKAENGNNREKKAHFIGNSNSLVDVMANNITTEGISLCLCMRIELEIPFADIYLHLGFNGHCCTLRYSCRVQSW